MRLSEETIKAAIVERPEPEVRWAAVRYFADSHSPDSTIMPRVIEAFEKYGHGDAFGYPPDQVECVTQLVQTEATLRWALAELPHSPSGRAVGKSILRGLIANAETEVLQTLRDEVLAFCTTEANKQLAEVVRFRLETAHWDAERCWQELERFCQEYAEVPYLDKAPYRLAQAIVDRLAQEPDVAAERIVCPLEQPVAESDDPRVWMQPLMARLAGRRRLEAAIPALVALLGDANALLVAECIEALIRIGSDAVVQTLANEYPAGVLEFRLDAAQVLSSIHTDRALAALLRVFELERDEDARTFLGLGLTRQYSPEAATAVWPWVKKGGYLEELGELDAELVIACKLLGHDLPGLAELRSTVEERWEKERKRRETKARFAPDRPEPLLPPKKKAPGGWSAEPSGAFGRLDESETSAPAKPIHVTHNVGRNDPCPCGSGKKFKKCCMRKEAERPTAD